MGRCEGVEVMKKICQIWLALIAVLLFVALFTGLWILVQVVILTPGLLLIPVIVGIIWFTGYALKKVG